MITPGQGHGHAHGHEWLLQPFCQPFTGDKLILHLLGKVRDGQPLASGKHYRCRLLSLYGNDAAFGIPEEAVGIAASDARAEAVKKNLLFLFHRP